jgi:hypothetical protein
MLVFRDFPIARKEPSYRDQTNETETEVSERLESFGFPSERDKPDGPALPFSSLLQ